MYFSQKTFQSNRLNRKTKDTLSLQLCLQLFSVFFVEKFLPFLFPSSGDHCGRTVEKSSGIEDPLWPFSCRHLRHSRANQGHKVGISQWTRPILLQFFLWLYSSQLTKPILPNSFSGHHKWMGHFFASVIGISLWASAVLSPLYCCVALLHSRALSVSSGTTKSLFKPYGWLRTVTIFVLFLHHYCSFLLFFRLIFWTMSIFLDCLTVGSIDWLFVCFITRMFDWLIDWLEMIVSLMWLIDWLIDRLKEQGRSDKVLLSCLSKFRYWNFSKVCHRRVRGECYRGGALEQGHRRAFTAGKCRARFTARSTAAVSHRKCHLLADVQKPRHERRGLSPHFSPGTAHHRQELRPGEPLYNQLVGGVSRRRHRQHCVVIFRQLSGHGQFFSERAQCSVQCQDTGRGNYDR